MRINIDWSKYPRNYAMFGVHDEGNGLFTFEVNDGNLSGQVAMHIRPGSTGFNGLGASGGWKSISAAEAAKGIVIEYEPGEHNTIWMIRRPSTAPASDDASPTSSPA